MTTGKRVLLLATTTGYQTRMFADAAASLGVDIVYGTDRCDQLEDPWQDGAIAVRYHEERASVDAVLTQVADRPVHGIIAVGDRPVVLAARLAQALGLPGHPPEAAAASRDKRLLRARLREARLPTPDSISVGMDANPGALAGLMRFPVVIKPAVLSGSRGVTRADDPESFDRAWRRLRQLLGSAEVRQLRDEAAGVIQIERYIEGEEYALEGLLEYGTFRVLALFDKPDPLTGPYFEETLYVTPSRASAARRAAIESSIAAAARAIGLWHGPVHAECRVTPGGEVFVLEVAARPIGGLCARALRFVHAGQTMGLEALVLRHALGESAAPWTREPAASGVMMIPIPKAGLYRRVHGLEDARRVAGIDEVTITAKPDQKLVPLPEGASYLGFIFARGAAPGEAEQALRDAHARLTFEIDPAIPLTRAN